VGVTDSISISQLQSQSQPEKPTTPLAQISVPPQDAQKIGQLPPPKPELTIIKTANSVQPQETSTSSIGSLTDVPLINSSNPDNFYVLYSQLSYNVVI